MPQAEFTFWVALPPGTRSLTLLHACAGFAVPFLDLRYGAPAELRALVHDAVQANLRGPAVMADECDTELLGFLQQTLPPSSRVVLSLRGAGHVESVPAFRERGIAAGFEVDSAGQAELAAAAGAEFLVASGTEAYGPVSAKTTLILVEELLKKREASLIVRGGLGPFAAAGARAAGCWRPWPPPSWGT